MSIETIAIWTGVILGIYGAALSSILAIREWKKDERRLKVQCDYGMLQDGSFGPPRPVITIRAINTGHRPVEIVEAALEFANRYKSVAIMDIDGRIPFPKIVEPGASFSIRSYFESIQTDLEQHRQTSGPSSGYKQAFVRDSLDKYYYCELPKIMREQKMVYRGRFSWPSR